MKNKNSLFYITKIKIRKIKNFIKTLIYLFFIKTSLKNIILFIKGYIYNKNNINFKYPVDTIFNDNDWFLEKTFLFTSHFESSREDRIKVKKILEVGSYEGRSSIFFLNFFNLVNLSCVDTWLGSDEHEIEKMSLIENNFDKNISKHDEKVFKFKMKSDDFFKNNNVSFDLIFVDGSHEYKQVLEDLKNSFKNLNLNGFLFIDDYDFKFKGYNLTNNVASAVNEFLKIKNKQIEIIYIYRQVLIKKIAD